MVHFPRLCQLQVNMFRLWEGPYTGWRFGTLFFFRILGILIPTDFHIFYLFQRGRPTTKQIIVGGQCRTMVENPMQKKKRKQPVGRLQKKSPSGLRGKGVLQGYSRVSEGHFYGVAILETWNNVILFQWLWDVFYLFLTWCYLLDCWTMLLLYNVTLWSKRFT